MEQNKITEMLQSENFYNVMMQYRMSPMINQDSVVAAFEKVKSHIAECSAELLKENETLKANAKKWFDAYKEGNEMFCKMAEVANNTKKENERLMAINGEMMDALKGILQSWNKNMGGDIEVLKTSTVSEKEYEYWSPSQAMVESERISKARAVIAKAEL